MRHWAGRGAAALYASDTEHFALLLERCSPGTVLSTAGGGARKRPWRRAPRWFIGCGARSPHGDVLESITDVAEKWCLEAEERYREFRPSFDRALVGKGLGLLRSLPLSATRNVVVHGDFNPGNIVRANREPWLAIDAKPTVGDPGIDPEPLAAQVDRPFARSNPAAVLRQRYALVADIVGEPAERLTAYGCLALTSIPRTTTLVRTVGSVHADRGPPAEHRQTLAGLHGRVRLP
ncbi:aminoglycoside phosphotransferase family protein [Streptomyces sp. NPDC059076]|uniref:aminoglycoside phosphotransferase family protein n=1 Tax=unclassified Streptomyces TaxID=2593676 RepID=UPI0036798EE6